MKKFSFYYHDGKFKYSRGRGWYYYTDKDNYLFSRGIYKTKIRENDLPDYFVKLWLYPRYKYVSLKGIVDVYYRPCFFTNHYRKDDLLYISYSDKLVIDDNGYAYGYDVLLYGSVINDFIKELVKYRYDSDRIDEIKSLIDKKDRWYKYWDEHNWNGNYSFTSDWVWKEILK